MSSKLFQPPNCHCRQQRSEVSHIVADTSHFCSDPRLMETTTGKAKHWAFQKANKNGQEGN